jgi:hypothetical protein
MLITPAFAVGIAAGAGVDAHPNFATRLSAIPG